MIMKRKALTARDTNETKVRVELNLDGNGVCDISTGVAFLDHMLEQLAKHALYDINVRCEGDIAVDLHHSVEDVGICLGRALEHALGDKKGIHRFADACVPMDEALCHVALDLSGRPFFHVDGELPGGMIGAFDAQLAEEFLRAFSSAAEMTLHVRPFYWKNAHHIVEGIFKALACALRRATSYDERRGDTVPSSKGVL